MVPLVLDEPGNRRGVAFGAFDAVLLVVVVVVSFFFFLFFFFASSAGEVGVASVEVGEGEGEGGEDR